MSDEIEKLRAGAKMLGVDVDVLIKEIAAAVAATMPQTVSPTGVNADAIVERVTEKIEGKLGGSLRTALSDALEKMDQRYQQLITSTIQSQLVEQLGAMKQALMQEFSRLLAERQGQAPSGEPQAEKQQPSPQGVQQSGNTDKVFSLLELLLKANSGGDSFVEELKKFVQMREALSSVLNTGGAPNSDLLFRANQQAFMEGVKLGAKGKGSPVPLTSSPPKSGGHLTTPGGRSTGDDILDSL